MVSKIPLLQHSDEVDSHNMLALCLEILPRQVRSGLLTEPGHRLLAKNAYPSTISFPDEENPEKAVLEFLIWLEAIIERA